MSSVCLKKKKKIKACVYLVTYSKNRIHTFTIRYLLKHT